MKRAIITMLCLGLVIVWSGTGLLSKETKETESKATEGDKLISKEINEENKRLDQQILDYNKKIENVISGYDLLNENMVIKTVPYQITFKRGKDFVELVRHKFVTSAVDSTKIIGITTKSIRIGISGKNVTKIESRVFKRNDIDGTNTTVSVFDPSPNTLETRDMKFEYSVNDRLIKDVTFDKIQNTTAFPIQNELKRDFYLEHLGYFFNVILNIAETHKKGAKDAETNMFDFLKESTTY